MAAEYNNILIICTDRDNDLGKKAKIAGPVIGRKANLNAAAKLALKDPEDSDVNSIFAAVKKYDEIREQFRNVNIVTLTGAAKLGFESDKKINKQLDSVLSKFPADGFVLVTDGAEDDQILPILQSRAPVISKQTVVVKQASQVESTYYTIKEFLKDPAIARIVFLVPGIILLLWGMLYIINAERFFYQAIFLVVGTYLVLKGTGLEDIIVASVRSAASAFSLQRVSFPFYLLSAIIMVLWGYSLYMTLTSPTFANMTEQVIFSLRQTMNFMVLAAIGFIIGKATDCIQLRKAIYLKNYFIYGSAVIILWYLLDAAIKVLAGEPYADISWFLANVLLAFAATIVAYKISGIIDVSKKATKLALGMPVYSKDGRILGVVEGVDRKSKSMKYREYESKSVQSIREGNFVIKGGRLLLWIKGS
jgi:putative membrane protein